MDIGFVYSRIKDMIWHILPINDLKEHEDKSCCDCCPSVEIVEGGDIIVLHNSYDGREQYEA